MDLIRTLLLLGIRLSLVAFVVSVPCLCVLLALSFDLELYNRTGRLTAFAAMVVVQSLVGLITLLAAREIADGFWPPDNSPESKSA